MNPTRQTSPRNHLWPCAALGAALSLALSCSKREEPPPAAAPAPAPAPKIAAAEVLRAPAPAPALPEVPAAAAPGADLEKIAQNAAAFSDLVDSLRKFAGEEVESNPARLDLESFVRGKSENDLLKFAEAAQYKSPFAAMQVLEHLLAQAADPQIRMVAAWRFADLAAIFGDASDRARARKCFDLLADFRADDAFVAALSPSDRDELLTAMQRLVLTLDFDEQSAYRQLAALLRNHPTSAEDLSCADWFDAMALHRSGQADNLPKMLTYLRAIRERGVYGRFYADKKTVDSWLNQSDDEMRAEYTEFWKQRAAYQPKIDARQRRLDALSPADRLAEMRRKDPAD